MAIANYSSSPGNVSCAHQVEHSATFSENSSHSHLARTTTVAHARSFSVLASPMLLPGLEEDQVREMTDSGMANASHKQPSPIAAYNGRDEALVATIDPRLLTISHSSNSTQPLEQYLAPAEMYRQDRELLNDRPTVHQSKVTAPASRLAFCESARSPSQLETTDAPVRTSSIQAQNFASAFAKTQENDPMALAAFDDLHKEYNKHFIDETAFYVDVCRLLHRTKTLHLLPLLAQSVPCQWTPGTLKWVHSAVKRECGRGQVEWVDSLQEQKRKKKRPINGYVAEPQLPRSRLRYKQETSLPPLRTFQLQSEQKDRTVKSVCKPSPPNGRKVRRALVLRPKMTSPGSTAANGRNAANSNTHGKTEHIDTASDDDFVAVDKASKPSARTSRKRRAPSSSPPQPPTKKPERKQYGNAHSSTVPHVGPVYPTRRAILSRASYPYIHAACGEGSKHPQDVKGHHRVCTAVQRQKQGGAEETDQGKSTGGQQQQQQWDEHESCKIGYPHVRYARVLDGFVVLDQESWDRIERAVGAGLRSKGEMSSEPGAQVEGGAQEESLED